MVRIVVEEIGKDVGALVVDSPSGSILMVDPRLSRREQMRLICSLLTDDEFNEVCSPFPELSVLAIRKAALQSA